MNLLSVSAFFKTFQPLRVQSILFSLKILPLDKENDHRLKKLLIVEKNYPCHYLRKPMDISMENMDIDIRE